MQKNFKINKIIFFVIILFLLISPIINVQSEKNIQNSISNNWHYLPSYPNYSPMGMPDFDQKQQESWKDWKGLYCFCGAACLANIFWWFDSKHENPNGFPGDGQDTYPLIQKLHPMNNNFPGPKQDDHNFNNVNDLNTEWNLWKRQGELIEQLAWHTYRYKDIKLFNYIEPIMPFYEVYLMIRGAHKWLVETGVRDLFNLKIAIYPSFSLIDNYVKKNCGIILGVFGYHNESNDAIFGHFITVAGINSEGYIAVCDPYFDKANYTNNYFLHNDPYYVSHDIHQIKNNPIYPGFGKFWIPNYFGSLDVVIKFALIISEKTN